MSVIFLLIPLSIVIAVGFLIAFVFAVRSGQYDDTYTPSMRVLMEETDRPDRDRQLAAGLVAKNNLNAMDAKETARGVESKIQSHG